MPELSQKAWHLSPWLATVNASRSTFYSWPEDIKPHTVLVGRHRLIVETPEAWLQRMAEREAAQKKPKRQRRIAQTEQAAA